MDYKKSHRNQCKNRNMKNHERTSVSLSGLAYCSSNSIKNALYPRIPIFLSKVGKIAQKMSFIKLRRMLRKKNLKIDNPSPSNCILQPLIMQGGGGDDHTPLGQIMLTISQDLIFSIIPDYVQNKYFQDLKFVLLNLFKNCNVKFQY